MPRDTVLRGYNIKVARGPVPVGAGDNGEPTVALRWVLSLSDRATGDRIQFTFDDDVRDYLVRELTGGIVLAGGDLPKV